MRIYSVHAGPGARPGDLALVRDGFSFAAAIAGPLWLVWHRLWRGLALWLCAILGVGLSAWIGRFDADTLFWLYGGIALLLGLEASTLRRDALVRAGDRLADVVAASTRDAAERSAFLRWSHRRVAAPSNPVLPRYAAPDRDAIGLFPGRADR